MNLPILPRDPDTASADREVTDAALLGVLEAFEPAPLPALRLPATGPARVYRELLHLALAQFQRLTVQHRRLIDRCRDQEQQLAKLLGADDEVTT